MTVLIQLNFHRIHLFISDILCRIAHFSPIWWSSMRHYLVTPKCTNNHEYKVTAVTDQNKEEENKYINVYTLFGILLVILLDRFTAFYSP